MKKVWWWKPFTFVFSRSVLFSLIYLQVIGPFVLSDWARAAPYPLSLCLSTVRAPSCDDKAQRISLMDLGDRVERRKEVNPGALSESLLRYFGDLPQEKDNLVYATEIADYVFGKLGSDEYFFALDQIAATVADQAKDKIHLVTNLLARLDDIHLTAFGSRISRAYGHLVADDQLQSKSLLVASLLAGLIMGRGAVAPTLRRLIGRTVGRNVAPALEMTARGVAIRGLSERLLSEVGLSAIKKASALAAFSMGAFIGGTAGAAIMRQEDYNDLDLEYWHNHSTRQQDFYIGFVPALPSSLVPALPEEIPRIEEHRRQIELMAHTPENAQSVLARGAKFGVSTLIYTVVISKLSAMLLPTAGLVVKGAMFILGLGAAGGPAGLVAAVAVLLAIGLTVLFVALKDWWVERRKKKHKIKDATKKLRENYEILDEAAEELRRLQVLADQADDSAPRDFQRQNELQGDIMKATAAMVQPIDVLWGYFKEDHDKVWETYGADLQEVQRKALASLVRKEVLENRLSYLWLTDDAIEREGAHESYKRAMILTLEKFLAAERAIFGPAGAPGASPVGVRDVAYRKAQKKAHEDALDKAYAAHRASQGTRKGEALLRDEVVVSADQYQAELEKILKSNRHKKRTRYELRALAQGRMEAIRHEWYRIVPQKYETRKEQTSALSRFGYGTVNGKFETELELEILQEVVGTRYQDKPAERIAEAERLAEGVVQQVLGTKIYQKRHPEILAKLGKGLERLTAKQMDLDYERGHVRTLMAHGQVEIQPEGQISVEPQEELGGHGYYGQRYANNLFRFYEFAFFPSQMEVHEEDAGADPTEIQVVHSYQTYLMEVESASERDLHGELGNQLAKGKIRSDVNRLMFMVAGTLRQVGIPLSHYYRQRYVDRINAHHFEIFEALADVDSVAFGELQSSGMNPIEMGVEFERQRLELEASRREQEAEEESRAG